MSAALTPTALSDRPAGLHHPGQPRASRDGRERHPVLLHARGRVPAQVAAPAVPPARRGGASPSG